MKTNTATQPTTATAPQRKHIRHDLDWEEKREIAYEIFDRISHGEMLRDICSEEGMPHPNTLRNWAYQDKPLACFYATAQKLRLDGLLEELMELTDLPAPMCKDFRGNTRVDTAAVSLMKHRFEAKKWIFNVLQRDPTEYGQRDPGLTHYPATRPLSPPRTPPVPVHSRVERDSLSASSGQPEGAAPEGAGNISERTSAVTSDDANSRKPLAATMPEAPSVAGQPLGTFQPALSLSNGPSLPQPQAHLPNHHQHMGLEPKAKTVPSATPAPVHKKSDVPSTNTVEEHITKEASTELNSELETQNFELSASPTPCAQIPTRTQMNAANTGTSNEINPVRETRNPEPSVSPTAGRSLRFRGR